MSSTTTQIDIVTCPIVNSFTFCGYCPIIDCLYFSHKCTHNCMLETTSLLTDNKGLSVSEITYYKYESPSKKLIRSLTKEKKEAITRIQLLYIFNYFLEDIRLNYTEYRSHLVNTLKNVSSKFLDRILSQYPFNIPIFKLVYADLVLLFTHSYFQEYVNQNSIQIDFDYLTIMNISQHELERAQFYLTKHLTKKGVTHVFS